MKPIGLFWWLGLIEIIFLAHESLGQSSAIPFNNQGIDSAKAGDLERALAFFNQAIQTDPNYGHAYHNRGNVKKDLLNDFDGAIQDYRTAIKLDPQICGAYVSLGAVMQTKKGNLSGAVDSYNQAIKCDPKNGMAYFLRGYILGFELGVSTRKSAVNDFNTAISLLERSGNSELANQARDYCLQVCRNHKSYGYTLENCPPGLDQ